MPTNPSSPRQRCDWLALWILFSAWCSASGWILSAFGCLDRAGYGVSFLFFLGGIFVWRPHLGRLQRRPVLLELRPFYSRYWLPKLWLALAAGALAGGLLYHPDNFDYLTYRFPRLLHWCWEHHWYWIQTPNDRQNISATGMEWLMAPLFVLFQNDRAFFVINWISYLFLPGLIFSVFRRLGIGGRICWWWMWILPAGFCYALQAGGMGNDLFAVVYLLGSLHYLFQAREEEPARNLVLSCLAVALLTGTKASNMPLVAPWLAVAWLNRKFLLPACRPAILVVVALAGAVVSFLPVALLNIHFTGGYTGDPHNERKLQAASPVAGIVGNSIEIAVGNISPPLWSHELSWNVLPSALDGYIRRNYPRFNIRAIPFQIEETAALGIGVVAFTALCGICGIRARVGRADRRIGIKAGTFLFAAATALAWTAYLAKMGSEAAPRLVAAYYIVWIAALLALLPLEGRIVHRWWWKLVGYAAIALVFPLVILSPARPLLPVRLIDTCLRIGVPVSVLAHLDEGFRVRSSRFDDLAELRRQIPATETAVGFFGGEDDPGASPWLPFGSHDVIDVNPHDTAGELSARHIHYVFVSDTALSETYKMKIEDLEKAWSMTEVAKANLVFKTHRGLAVWYLLRS